MRVAPRWDRALSALSLARTITQSIRDTPSPAPSAPRWRMNSAHNNADDSSRSARLATPAAAANEPGAEPQA